MRQKIESLRSFFDSGATKTLQFRLDMLSRLERVITDNIPAIAEALRADLGKSLHESLLAEISPALDEIRYVRKNLSCWMKPQRAHTPFTLWPGKSRIYSEPRGLVLILAPWNYPLMLSLAPMAGAMAAGNTVVLKPSEVAAKTSHLLQSLLSKAFPESFLAVIEGGIPETTQLLNEKFDYIFFTGSPAVGKIIYQAAARQMTPVTLELGGKSPAIVHYDADLDLAVRRITWGKFMNAGQTCIAPDYVYVHKDIADEFIKKVSERIEVQFSKDPSQSSDYGRIINERNFDRLAQLMKSSVVKAGGDADRSQRYIEPTVLLPKSWQEPVMQEEIFGPLLPILTYENYDEVIKTIKKQEKPLAAYLFSQSSSLQKEFLAQLSFGGGCINDVLLHIASVHLPFGGVGGSGIGAYHGRKSFEIFSHQKGIISKSKYLDLDLRYPPYTAKKTSRLKRLFGIT